MNGVGMERRGMGRHMEFKRKRKPKNRMQTAMVGKSSQRICAVQSKCKKRNASNGKMPCFVLAGKQKFFPRKKCIFLGEKKQKWMCEKWPKTESKLWHTSRRLLFRQKFFGCFWAVVASVCESHSIHSFPHCCCLLV